MNGIKRIVIVLVFALMGLGGVYGAWGQGITVKGSISTTNLDTDFVVEDLENEDSDDKSYEVDFERGNFKDSWEIEIHVDEECVSSRHEYKMTLKNRGVLPVNYSFRDVSDSSLGVGFNGDVYWGEEIGECEELEGVEEYLVGNQYILYELSVEKGNEVYEVVLEDLKEVSSRIASSGICNNIDVGELVVITISERICEGIPREALIYYEKAESVEEDGVVTEVVELCSRSECLSYQWKYSFVIVAEPYNY